MHLRSESGEICKIKSCRLYGRQDVLASFVGKMCWLDVLASFVGKLCWQALCSERDRQTMRACGAAPAWIEEETAAATKERRDLLLSFSSYSPANMASSEIHTVKSNTLQVVHMSGYLDTCSLSAQRHRKERAMLSAPSTPQR